MPGEIPNKSVQDIFTILKRGGAVRVDKVEKEVTVMINTVLDIIGAEMYPEDRSTVWGDVEARLVRPAAGQPLLVQGNLLRNPLARVHANSDADAMVIGMVKAKSFIRRTAGKKVTIADQDAKSAAIFLYVLIAELISNAALKTVEDGKVVMTEKHFYSSIKDDGNEAGKNATGNHELLAVFRAKNKSIRVRKSSSKKPRRQPPNCKKREISVNAYVRSDGKSVAGSCRKKKSKSRKSKSRKSRSSKKKCSAGKHYRKGYKSSSGKRVRGKCVKNKSTSR